jgi:hypothetical protein
MRCRPARPGCETGGAAAAPWRWRCAAAAGRRGEHAGFSFPGGPGPQQAATASRPRFRRAAAVSRGVWSETDRDRNSLPSRRAPPTDDPLVPCVCVVKIKYKYCYFSR